MIYIFIFITNLDIYNTNKVRVIITFQIAIIQIVILRESFSFLSSISKMVIYINHLYPLMSSTILWPWAFVPEILNLDLFWQKIDPLIILLTLKTFIYVVHICKLIRPENRNWVQGPQVEVFCDWTRQIISFWYLPLGRWTPRNYPYNIFLILGRGRGNAPLYSLHLFR